MRTLRQLRHWLTDRGKRIHVSDFVPPTHPLRQWSDTFPWKGMVGAVEAHFARRFPQQHTGGQAYTHAGGAGVGVAQGGNPRFR